MTCWLPWSELYWTWSHSTGPRFAHVDAHAPAVARRRRRAQVVLVHFANAWANSVDGRGVGDLRARVLLDVVADARVAPAHGEGLRRRIERRAVRVEVGGDALPGGWARSPAGGRRSSCGRSARASRRPTPATAQTRRRAPRGQGGSTRSRLGRSARMRGDPRGGDSRATSSTARPWTTSAASRGAAARRRARGGGTSMPDGVAPDEVRGQRRVVGDDRELPLAAGGHDERARPARGGGRAATSRPARSTASPSTICPTLPTMPPIVRTHASAPVASSPATARSTRTWVYV